MYCCETWIMKRLSTKESTPLNSVQEKTLQSLLDCKVIKPVNPKGNRPWIIIKRTDAEAPILWPPDAKSQLIGKDLDAGKDWGQKEKWETEDMMVGWYRWLNGHEFEQALGDSEGWESLVRYSPWGHEESDTTEWLSSNYHHNVSFPFWMLWVFQLKKKKISKPRWLCGPLLVKSLPPGTLHIQRHPKEVPKWPMVGRRHKTCMPGTGEFLSTEEVVMRLLRFMHHDKYCYHI